MKGEQITPFDAAMSVLFHAGRQRRGASEFYRSAYCLVFIRAIISTVCALVLGGCSRTSGKTTLTALGGPYYKEYTVIPCPGWFRMEPGNCNLVRYLYVESGRTNEMTRYLGGFADSIYRQFSYRIYGSNFVYVEREDGNWSKFRLRGYSTKNGNVTVDEDFGRYWKVIVDEHGITCHRYQDGQERDDPQPVIYTADYLGAL